MATAARIVRIDGERYATQRVLLELSDDYQFSAGQYLNVLHPDGSAIPLSIASAPHRLPELVLHYRSTPNLTEAAAMDSLLTQPAITLSAAAGDVTCPAVDVPLLMIAGGSGAAQAFSCAEQRAEDAKQLPPVEETRCIATTLVWCADQSADLHGLDYLEQCGVELIPIIDDRRTPENEGLVWLAEHASAFHAHHIIIAGGPAFVYVVTDLLIEQRIAPHQLHADAYSYAPRG